MQKGSKVGVYIYGPRYSSTLYPAVMLLSEPACQESLLNNQYSAILSFYIKLSKRAFFGDKTKKKGLGIILGVRKRYEKIHIDFMNIHEVTSLT